MRIYALAYVVLIAASHLLAPEQPQPSLNPGEGVISLNAVDGDRELDGVVDLTYWLGQPDTTVETIVLLHGSPGNNGAFWRVGPLLARNYRVIAPDLPGFGSSTRDIPDYSIRAHARYMLQALDSLGITSAHIVGFSMGGGVAINMADISPERISSVTLLSSIGVQELELLGDYYLNHSLHALQLAGIWSIKNLIPHFGLMGGGFLTYEYARNFYDTDQRPLRGILTEMQMPVLIIQGENDPLVPAAAAREHHRIVPQSELLMIEGDHFMVFQRPGDIAPYIDDWVSRVANGAADTRPEASPERLAAAERPFEATRYASANGFAVAVVLVLLAVATLVSEDLACLGAGLLVARGTIGFVPGIAACFIGIFIGDILLFATGRVLGRAAIVRAPLRWFISEEAVERSSRWFRSRGAAIIFLSRFAPGARLPTFVAAGILRTRFARIGLYMALAAAVWTPLLVGVAWAAGPRVYGLFEQLSQNTLLLTLVTGISLLVAYRLMINASTHRGRRLLLSRWRRLTRWEFWPVWVFYIPVVLYILLLAIRYRSLTVFTAANPGIEHGGMAGESKHNILRLVEASDRDRVARSRLIESRLSEHERVRAAEDFLDSFDLGLPVVVKPDVGERGEGVTIVRDAATLDSLLRQSRRDLIIQEYVPGLEAGVFYYRRPDEESGHIFSVTDKRFPAVRGNGEATLEQLILDDERAVCSARMFLNMHQTQLDIVPEVDTEWRLAELGTHCRGSEFRDGSHLITAPLAAAIDRLSRGVDGFYFGRYDIRYESRELLEQGEGFKVIELNGVTSESTNIYDSSFSLLAAYRTLFRQWALAFDIGRLNQARGVQPTPLFSLIRLLYGHIVGSFRRSGARLSAAPTIGETADVQSYS